MPSIIFSVLVAFGVVNLPWFRAQAFNCTNNTLTVAGTIVTARDHVGQVDRSVAETVCRNHHEQLVTIKSQEKKEAFEKWVAGCCRGHFCAGFLGMTRTASGDYQWTDDSSSTFISNLSMIDNGSEVAFAYRDQNVTYRRFDGRRAGITAVCEKSITSAATTTSNTESSATSPSPTKPTSSTTGTETTSSSVAGSVASRGSATNTTSTTTGPKDEETPLIVWISIGIIAYCVIQLVGLFLYVQWDIRREKQEIASAAATASAPASSTRSDGDLKKKSPTMNGRPMKESQGGSARKYSTKSSVLQ